ncbi:hypothetical protein PTKIN_Ptkin17bG0153300 [Pterospermum kingtungense]
MVNHLSSLLINYPFHQEPPNPVFPIKTLIFTFVYITFTSIFSLLAAGSITYSVFHGFYGRPVKLLSTIKSAFTSFFRLLSTTLVSELIISGVLLVLGLILFLLVKATQFIGFQVDFSSPYFTSLLVVFLIIFVSIAFYFSVNWVFAHVVVVTESSWGLEPLKRSQSLVKGLKGVAFSMLVFFGFLNWFFTWSTTSRWGDTDREWKSWQFVLSIVSTSTMLMLIMLYNLAASTVFYMYSKAIHGELAAEIAQEFAAEYVSLPFDDGKVPHVVSVVYG